VKSVPRDALNVLVATFTGTLFAVIWPNDPLLPCDVRCTACDGRWSADQWHALGRRVEAVAKAEGEIAS